MRVTAAQIRPYNLKAHELRTPSGRTPYERNAHTLVTLHDFSLDDERPDSDIVGVLNEIYMHSVYNICVCV